MPTFVKINDFVEDIGKGVHNLSTGVLKLALSNTAPGSEAPDPTTSGNGVVANVTQIAYTNVSGGQPTLASITFTETGGTATLDAADEVILASGGAVPTFRYIYLFNDTPTSPADPLIGYWDNGSAIDLADTESLTWTVDTNILTIT
ncbi:hypothetical protein KAU11_11550 [Candidatus Babeliales bacterium]|nr:hypothetical protein [Candidatus Babeliales bacterium]